MSRKEWSTAVLAAITAVAAAIRFWRLDHFSYGFDEIMQTYFIQGTWEFFWAASGSTPFIRPLTT